MRSAPKDSGALRVVAGVIPGASGAGPWTGPGWMATKTSTGVYVLHFTPSFRAPPVITVSPTGSAANVVCATGNITGDAATVYLLIGNTNAVIDFWVAFQAEGPA